MPSFNQLPRPGLTPSKKKLKMSNSFFDFSSFTKEHEQPTPDQPIDPLPLPMPINHQLKMSDSFLGDSTEPPRGFDSTTMVVEGGHYPDFFPLMVDAPSPITVKAPPWVLCCCALPLLSNGWLCGDHWRHIQQDIETNWSGFSPSLPFPHAHTHTHTQYSRTHMFSLPSQLLVPLILSMTKY